MSFYRMAVVGPNRDVINEQRQRHSPKHHISERHVYNHKQTFLA